VFTLPLFSRRLLRRSTLLLFCIYKAHFPHNKQFSIDSFLDWVGLYWDFFSPTMLTVSVIGLTPPDASYSLFATHIYLQNKRNSKCFTRTRVLDRDGPDPIRPELLLTHSNKQEANPPLTKAPFWPVPKIFFLTRRVKKLKNLVFLGEIFQNQPQTIDGWPDPTGVKNFWPGSITSFGSMVNSFSLLAWTVKNDLIN